MILGYWCIWWRGFKWMGSFLFFGDFWKYGKITVIIRYDRELINTIKGKILSNILRGVMM
jgi:hypothetical protein